jgi:nucleotide-binding universal stress UspA family protein
VAALPAEARALPVFIRGFPDQELIKAAEYGVDLLVLGSRAGGPVRRLLHHSVSSTVMREASCPVLISPSNVAAPQATLA